MSAPANNQTTPNSPYPVMFPSPMGYPNATGMYAPYTLPYGSQYGSFQMVPGNMMQPGFLPTAPPQLRKKKKNRRGKRKESGARTPAATPSPLVPSVGGLLGPATFEPIKASTPSGLRLLGREICRAVTLSGDAIKGKFTIAYAPLSAQPNGTEGGLFLFTRVSRISGTFEMFVYHSITFTFVPCQYGISGTLAMYVENDYADPPETSVVAMMRNQSSSINTINAAQSVTVTKASARSDRFFCDSPSNTSRVLIYQGALYWAVEGVGVRETIPDGTTVGYIVGQYDIEFFTPC